MKKRTNKKKKALLPVENSIDATFRRVGRELNDQLTAAGWIKTTDSGPIEFGIVSASEPSAELSRRHNEILKWTISEEAVKAKVREIRGKLNGRGNPAQYGMYGYGNHYALTGEKIKIIKRLVEELEFLYIEAEKQRDRIEPPLSADV